jgi:hypothetical protein
LADFLPNWDISRGFFYILFAGGIREAAMHRGHSSESIPALLKCLQIQALVAMGHKITNVPLILKIWEVIFFVFGQITLWAISRDILRGPRNNLGVKKVEAPQNIPRNGP